VRPGRDSQHTDPFSERARYGALSNVTFPTGGAASFKYQASPLSYVNRSLGVPTPSIDPITGEPRTAWGQPLVHATDILVVVPWYGIFRDAHQSSK
jgi:hypothetical protein